MAAVSDDNMLARLGIKRAQRFDWGDEPHISATDINKSKLTMDHAPPSGLDSIKKFVQDDNGTTAEKQILHSLLKDANIDIPTQPTPSVRTQESCDLGQLLMQDTIRDVPTKGYSDRAVAELTVECRTSLFGSILRLFDPPRDGEIGANTSQKDSNTGGKGDPASQQVVSDPMVMKEPILSTAEIVRSVHLAARPGDIPSGMDSKEYTMAALNFLSSYVPYLHENTIMNNNKNDKETFSQVGWDQLRDTLPVFPLLKATNPNESLELRSYGRVRPLVKLGGNERKDPHTMDRDQSFRLKVLNLERIYASSLPYSPTCTLARLSTKLASESALYSLPNTNTTTTTQKSAIPEPPIDGNDLPFAFQRYVPRRKVVPHIEGGAKEELTLMISGHMQQPQHTPGPKKGTKSTSPASASGGEKGVAQAKRKADTAKDGLLHHTKKAKEFNL